MGTLKDYQELPNQEAAQLARSSASELSRLLSEKPDADRASVKMDGHNMILPRQAISLLRDLLADMAQGSAVTIVPMHAEMTTQQAANILNVSRPHLIKLLGQGELNFTKVGTHRRIRFEDLMEYKQKLKQQSAQAMDELVEQAQEHEMGY
ncbi:MAG: helix-turn-helix domain-containing protein [Kordiimonadaceae bacterium]|nr:helix-turn-helix domain-containing protein [Kordiimonadaceae bacterium]PCJ36923.1 MAG: DNA-binding protein [Cellvibrionales bacterium]